MLTTENSLLLIVDVQGKLAQIMDNREALFANLQRMVKRPDTQPAHRLGRAVTRKAWSHHPRDS